MLKPFKFLVQVVALEVDEDDNPIGERVSQEPNILYGVQALKDFADIVEEKIEALNDAG